MIRGKIAGVTIGGCAAFLLIHKAMNVVTGVVRDICTANEWKNYYKYGKDGNVVAPGYSMHTHVNEDGNEIVVEDERQKNAAQKPAEGSIADALTKAIKDSFAKRNEAEGASEGETEASEEEENDIDPDLYKVTNPQKFKDYVDDCRKSGMTEKEIAMSLGMPLDIYRKNVSEVIDILAERPVVEESEPLYTDDLYDGIKVVEESDEEDKE